MLSAISRAKLLVPLLLSLVGVIVLLALGTWQLNRRNWKDGLLATLKSRGASPPISANASWPGLPCHDLKDTGLANPCEYQSVALRGVFDHARERHIFTAAPQAPGLGSGRGFWVLTPLILDGSGKTVFVNRGFVPEAKKEAATRVEGQPNQAVEVVGLYRSAQERGTFDGQNDAARNIWYVRSPQELWPADPDAPRLTEMWAYVDLTGPTPSGGFPLPLAGKNEISNRHLEYAITWYALALTLIGVVGTFAYGRLRAGMPSSKSPV
jgi:surfeit locus 1 family protein